MGVYLSPGLSANVERAGLWAYGVRWQFTRLAHDIGIIDFVIPPLTALLVGGVGWYVIQLANSASEGSVSEGQTTLDEQASA